jgi:hypothetical protein
MSTDVAKQTSAPAAAAVSPVKGSRVDVKVS